MYGKGNLMIETLEGIREIANFKEGMHLCLYDNDNVEDYPPHWHAPIEIIMPIENTYRAVCDNVEYMIYPDQILLINSGVIHSLRAAPDFPGRLYSSSPDPRYLQCVSYSSFHHADYSRKQRNCPSANPDASVADS